MFVASIFWLAFFVNFSSCVQSQAPGDGDQLCVDATINGSLNPFFTNLTYPANERPLMDSRHYVALLEGDNPPWQQMDDDENSTNHLVKHVTMHVDNLYSNVICYTEFYSYMRVLVLHHANK